MCDKSRFFKTCQCPPHVEGFCNNSYPLHAAPLEHAGSEDCLLMRRAAIALGKDFGLWHIPTTEQRGHLRRNGWGFRGGGKGRTAHNDVGLLPCMEKPRGMTATQDRADVRNCIWLSLPRRPGSPRSEERRGGEAVR